MSTTTRKHPFGRKLFQQVPVFAALGDEERLSLLVKLSRGELLSITQLAAGTNITRQAITKHLRILEEAGLVRGTKLGRENLFALEPEALQAAEASLRTISQQWDQALARLKAFVEE